MEYALPNECSICLSEMNDKDVYILKKCSHMFHKSCFSKWFVKSNTCPICRSIVAYNFLIKFCPISIRVYILKIEDNSLIFFRAKKSKNKNSNELFVENYETKQHYKTIMFRNIRKISLVKKKINIFFYDNTVLSFSSKNDPHFTVNTIISVFKDFVENR